MVICEIGQNHMGDMTLAKQLISLAQTNGGDLCKFQLYDHSKLYAGHPEIPNVELSFDQAKMLFDYGKEAGIEVFFSVFNIERVRWCEKIGVKKYKIGYNQRNNKKLIQAVIDTRKEAFVSTNADGEFESWGAANFKELYCVAKYPADLEDLEFEGREDSWDSLNTFDLIPGFSDHTIGLDAAKIALARGAKIIEKHFAIDHQTGIDAAWSMTPEELRELKRWEGVCKLIM